jgi:hypothetical protein
MGFEKKTLPVGKLLLDVRNPRHEQVASQRDAIAALITGQRQKLVALASDILEFGMSPIDVLLVIRAGRNYTVLEGNRRLAVLKMLFNPNLARDTVIATQIERLARKGSGPATLDCAIAPTRRDAEHWMELRHGRGFEGAEVVPWNALAANRFSQNPGREASAAIRFLEAVEAAYPKNEVMAALVARVAERRLTSLGRLVLDEGFKARVGLVDEDGELSFHFSATQLEGLFEHLLGDFAADVGVSQVRTKPMRKKYLESVPAPDPRRRSATATPLAPSASSKRKPKPKRRRSPAKAKPFKNLDLSDLATKTQALVRELQTLNFDKAPHAAAILIRAILELSVDEYIELKGLGKKRTLRDRVKACLAAVDPTQKDERFRAVRTGLQDGSSLYAVGTLHEFVHNRYFQADHMHVGTIADNVEPFLQALNDDI